MPKLEEGTKEDVIKDSVLKIIKGSETIATQTVNSTAAVLKASLDNAEALGVRASDILLSTARRAIDAGNVIGSDIREATKSMVKGTIQTASDIGNEIKGSASTSVQGRTPAEEPEEKVKSE
jgi:hypothetical protein